MPGNRVHIYLVACCHVAGSRDD